MKVRFVRLFPAKQRVMLMVEALFVGVPLLIHWENFYFFCLMWKFYRNSLINYIVKRFIGNRKNIFYSTILVMSGSLQYIRYLHFSSRWKIIIYFNLAPTILTTSFENLSSRTKTLALLSEKKERRIILLLRGWSALKKERGDKSKKKTWRIL